MRIIYTVELNHNGFFAKFRWRDDLNAWRHTERESSEGFFDMFPDIPRVITEQQMTLIALKYSQ